MQGFAADGINCNKTFRKARPYKRGAFPAGTARCTSEGGGCYMEALQIGALLFLGGAALLALTAIAGARAAPLCRVGVLAALCGLWFMIRALASESWEA